MYKTLIPGAIGHGKPIGEAVIGAADAGFEGIWLSAADLEGPVGETAKLLEDAGLRAAGFDLPVRFRGGETEFLEDMKGLRRLAERAARLGASRCATWISPASDSADYSRNLSFHAERLGAICGALGEYGVLFGLEFVGTPSARANARYEFIYNLDGALELCDATGAPNCGLLLDLWHWDMAGQGSGDFSKLSNGRVALVHVNDAPIGADLETRGDSPRELPGETGILRAAEFMEGLRSIGYDGPIAAEPFRKDLAEMSYEGAMRLVSRSIDRIL